MQLSNVFTKGGRFTGVPCELGVFWVFVSKMATGKLPSRHFWPFSRVRISAPRTVSKIPFEVWINLTFYRYFGWKRGIFLVSRTYITWVISSFIVNLERLVGWRLGPLIRFTSRPCDKTCLYAKFRYWTFFKTLRSPKVSWLKRDTAIRICA